MKKIITSLGMIVFAAAIVVGDTGAFFSDTETSTGNVFTAGALDLKIDSVSHYNGMVCTLVGQTYRWIPDVNITLDVDNQPVAGALMDELAEWTAYNAANPLQYPQAGVACTGTWPLADIGEGQLNVGTFFNFNDIKPGDQGENTISIHVDNNDAWMCVSLDKVAGADLEGTATEPEKAVDNTFGSTLAASELDENLHFFAWIDDGDNVFEVEEVSLGKASASELANQTWALADSTTGNGPITGGDTQYIGLYWCAGEITVSGTNLSCDGEEMGNEAQTDSWSADLSFYIEQARNNEDFRCVPAPRVCEYSEVATGDPRPGEYGSTVTPVTVTYTDCTVKTNVLKVESAQSYSGTGWAGWSCVEPGYTDAIGGGVIGGNAAAQGLAQVSAPAVGGFNYPVYPHYTFGTGEEGWVAQAGVPIPTGIYALCAATPS